MGGPIRVTPLTSKKTHKDDKLGPSVVTKDNSEPTNIYLNSAGPSTGPPTLTEEKGENCDITKGSKAVSPGLTVGTGDVTPRPIPPLTTVGTRLLPVS